MAVDCQNIYKNARKSAGMTQEKAAQLLNVSVDSLRDYEQSQRPVPSDVASAMCDVYQAPYLAVQHLRRSSELGKRVVPEIQLKDLPEAVLSVLAAVQRFIVKRDAMIEIVADGKIEEDEQAEWNEIMDRMNNLFVAMANMRFFERRASDVKESYFIGVSEVQEIVGCSKSRAYQFIQQMNKELEAKGLLTFPGRVPRRYVFERFGITEVQDDAKGNNPAGGNSGGATTGNRKHRRGVRFPTERNAALDSDDSCAS